MLYCYYSYLTLAHLLVYETDVNGESKQLF